MPDFLVTLIPGTDIQIPEPDRNRSLEDRNRIGTANLVPGPPLATPTGRNIVPGMHAGVGYLYLGVAAIPFSQEGLEG